MPEEADPIAGENTVKRNGILLRKLYLALYQFPAIEGGKKTLPLDGPEVGIIGPDGIY